MQIKIILLFLPLIFQAPKNTSKIILPSGSKDEGIKNVSEILLDNGFEIESINQEFGLIRSGTKSLSKLDVKYYLYFRCKEGSIEITGKYQVTNISLDFETIQNRGMKGSPTKSTFEEMDTFAGKISDIKEYKLE